MLNNNPCQLLPWRTGSFGKFVETILRDYHQVKIIIYSRDDLGQFELKQKYPESPPGILAPFLLSVMSL